jgi:formate hydrogenlyase subunit 3/multisubunit Na+/H+ antiporter MnhD subunit
MTAFLFLVVWPSMCIAVALAASRRANRNPWGWFALSFFLSPFVGLMFLLAVGRKPPKMTIYPPPGSRVRAEGGVAGYLVALFAVVAFGVIMVGYQIGTTWQREPSYNTTKHWSEYQSQKRP